MRARHALLIAIASLVCSCGPSESLEPVPSTMSAVAAAHLEEVLAQYQTHSVRRRVVDWKALRTEVFRVSAMAQTEKDTYNGILKAMELVADGHSNYLTPSGTRLNAIKRTCTAEPVPQLPPALPPDIGYVRVRGFSGTAAQANTYAQALADTIKNRDAADLIGWIVDLRSNTGGNMYPMVAGIGPLLNADTLGWFVDADGARVAWRYAAGASFYGNYEQQRVSAPYIPRSANRPIVVLMDGLTASSGEAVLLSFVGRPKTRLMGIASCGLSSGNVTVTLANGDLFAITASVMADRKGKSYGDRIAPDEELSLGTDMIERAVSWLRTQS